MSNKDSELDDIMMVAAHVLDDYLAKHWPDVRFGLHVWRHDNPALPTGGGDVAFTTNDVPRAKDIMRSLATRVDEVDDPNAPSPLGFN